jgi:PAS domain-containing protein
MAIPEINTLRARFFVRVILPGILAFCLFTALILGYLIPGFERAMMERKQETTRELTRSAWSILEYYHGQEASGLLSRQDAMVQARNAVKELRYGDEAKDYFWITDRQPLMIMHPYRPDLDGKDLSDFRDPDGKALFVEFVKVTAGTGDGFVDYRWQWKDDSLRIVPKLSYVRVFEPWGWIIGTGIYIEDVRSEIKRMENRAVLISGGIGLLIIILLVIITRQSHRIEISRRRAEQELMESHERYKTLAEAASEGVLIWSGQGVHANKTLIEWLGFPEAELAGLTLGEIIPDAGLARFTSPEIMSGELSTRMFVECSLLTKSGEKINVHADFSRILLSEEQAVMMVARPLQVTRNLQAAAFGEELLDHAATGFYRTTLSKKGRFISVSDPVRGLLGMDRNLDITSTTLESCFHDGKEYKLYQSMLEETGKVSGLAVMLKRADGRLIWAILNAIVRDDVPGEKWFEGTIEPVSLSGASDYLPAAGLSDLNYTVRAANGAIPGIRQIGDLHDAWYGMPENIIQRISAAGSTAEIKLEYQASCGVSGSLIEGGADPYLTVRFISRVGDAIVKRSLELLLEKSGPPPVEFAILQLGSAGRCEQSLATDQDNAIIFADVPESEMAGVQSWFVTLGSTLNETLEEIGYRKCQGGIMTGNPRWCQSLEKWKSDFSGWTRNPGPDELLEMSIFFDLAFVAGNPAIVDSLREFIRNDLRTNDIYFHHMAAAWKPFSPDRHISGQAPVNLKKLLMPLTGLVRLYAMRHAIQEPTLIEKCIGLYKAGVFSQEELTGTIGAWKTLMKLRLVSQYRMVAAGNQPDNQLDPALLDLMLKHLLEKAIQQIENLMLKASSDFYTQV